VLRGSLAACVAAAALCPRQQPPPAPWLQYTLLQTGLMATASLAAKVSPGHSCHQHPLV